MKEMNERETLKEYMKWSVERDKKLAKTDWMTLSDTTTITDAWKTYRQQLRDLPASANPKLDARGELDLTSVTFPSEPE